MRTTLAILAAVAVGSVTTALCEPPAKIGGKPLDTAYIRDLKDVSWGPVADGLRAGVRITGNKRIFHAGERVPLEAFLQNASDHDIALTYASRVYCEEVPKVHGTGPGTPVQKVEGVLLTGIDPAFSLILPAGCAVLVPLPALGLGEKQNPVPLTAGQATGLEKYPYLQDASPGARTVQQSFLYHISTADEVARLNARSHSKEAIVIEPFKVTLMFANGSSRTVEATTIPHHSETSVVTSGGARFEIKP